MDYTATDLELTITADAEDREMLAELGDEIHADATMYEAFAGLINTGLDWIRPDECGDLTSAPLLGFRDENGDVLQRWGYEPYALRSPLVDLRDTGQCVFRSRW